MVPREPRDRPRRREGRGGLSSVLVTGGAGYIGSAFVEALVAAGERVAVLDDLSRGHRAAVHPQAAFHEGRTGDRALVARIAREQGIDACVHFAAFAYVGESVSEPGRYFDNNFTQAQALFDALLERRREARRVLARPAPPTASPTDVPIAEGHPQWPINPYGWSKLFVERMLDELRPRLRPALRRRCATSTPPGATATRAARTTSPRRTSSRSCCAPPPGASRRSRSSATTTTRPTAPAIRDYIHVDDLAQAHLLGARAAAPRRRLAVPEPRHRHRLLGARGDRDGRGA